MNHRFTRRAALPMIGTLGLTAFVKPAIGRAFDEKDAGLSPATFLGTWTYRSFLSNPDISVDFNTLEFARATIVIDSAPQGILRGRLSFGNDYLALKGSISYGNPFTARFQGTGATAGTKGWIYDYLGFLVPDWPDGVDQRAAIVGSVIRTVPHSDGKAKAGVVASFIAVKHDS
jgi:hypothetical protein